LGARTVTDDEVCSLHHHCASVLLRSCLCPLVAIVGLLSSDYLLDILRRLSGQHCKNRHLPLAIQSTVFLLDLHSRGCNLSRPPSHRRRPLCNRLYGSGRERGCQHHQGRSNPTSRGPGVIPYPLWRLLVRAAEAQGAKQFGQECAHILGVLDLDGGVHLDAVHLQDCRAEGWIFWTQFPTPGPVHWIGRSVSG
jgi:hypothetical protein